MAAINISKGSGMCDGSQATMMDHSVYQLFSIVSLCRLINPQVVKCIRVPKYLDYLPNEISFLTFEYFTLLHHALTAPPFEWEFQLTAGHS